MPSTAFDDTISLSRKLTPAESNVLQERLRPYITNTANIAEDEEEFVTDLLEYAVTMVSNSKTVRYVIDNLIGMGMDFCNSDTAEQMGADISNYLQTALGVQSENLDVSTTSEKPRMAVLKKATEDAGSNALTMSGALGSSREGGRSKQKQQPQPDEKKKALPQERKDTNKKGGNTVRDKSTIKNDRRDERGKAFDRLTSKGRLNERGGRGRGSDRQGERDDNHGGDRGVRSDRRVQDDQRREGRGQDDQRREGRGQDDRRREGRGQDDRRREGRGQDDRRREGRGQDDRRREGRGQDDRRREGRGQDDRRRGGRGQDDHRSEGRGQGDHRREGRGQGDHRSEGRGQEDHRRQGGRIDDHRKGSGRMDDRRNRLDDQQNQQQQQRNSEHDERKGGGRGARTAGGGRGGRVGRAGGGRGDGSEQRMSGNRRLRGDDNRDSRQYQEDEADYIPASGGRVDGGGRLHHPRVGGGERAPAGRSRGGERFHGRGHGRAEGEASGGRESFFPPSKRSRTDDNNDHGGSTQDEVVEMHEYDASQTHSNWEGQDGYSNSYPSYGGNWRGRGGFQTYHGGRGRGGGWQVGGRSNTWQNQGQGGEEIAPSEDATAAAISGAVNESLSIHPSPIVQAANAGYNPSYFNSGYGGRARGRGRGFYQSGYGGRGFGGPAADVKTMLASRTWVRNKEGDGGGGGDNAASSGEGA